MDTPPAADLELDATGLRCPLPVLRANRALRSLRGGQLLRVRATDQAARADFPAFCRTAGHVLEWSGEQGGELIFLIRKAPQS